MSVGLLSVGPLSVGLLSVGLMSVGLSTLSLSMSFTYRKLFLFNSPNYKLEHENYVKVNRQRLRGEIEQAPWI